MWKKYLSNITRARLLLHACPKYQHGCDSAAGNHSCANIKVANETEVSTDLFFRTVTYIRV